MTETQKYKPGYIVRYLGKHGMMAGYYVRHIRGKGGIILDSPEMGRQVRIKESQVLAVKQRIPNA